MIAANSSYVFAILLFFAISSLILSLEVDAGAFLIRTRSSSCSNLTTRTKYKYHNDLPSTKTVITKKKYYGYNSIIRKKNSLSLLASSSSSSDNINTDNNNVNQISIEYCTGCKWNLRGFWMAQELLLTFSDETAFIHSVTLIPSSNAGTFLVRCYNNNNKNITVWDRKDHGRFPEIKELKQLVRDVINPNKYLGHSDSKENRDVHQNETIDKSEQHTIETADIHNTIIVAAVSPHISIQYCTGCRWMLRAAYYAQELCTTFADELNSITLIPSPIPDGNFIVTLDDDNMIWNRKEQGRFPETKELKQLIRDQLNPNKNLGHSDVKPMDEQPSLQIIEEIDNDDDDEASAEARKYFGVF